MPISDTESLGRLPNGRRRQFRWPKLLTRDGRGIAYGGDYNPDQWPESVWDDDIRLMKRASVNTVALGIFSWDRIQPTEDTWDFDWLDRIIDKLGAAGIAVDLASATAAAPIWLYIKHPEVLPVEKNGDVVNPGSRQSWRPTSPVFREYALELCRRLATHYRDNPAVTAWHMDNEYGWNNRYDYSDDSQRAFRQWCEKEYGSIDALNEAWGTAFWSQEVRSFDEVLLPRHMGGDSMVNPSQQLDFERFGSEALKALYIAERDAIENICPDKPFTTNFMVSTDQCVMDYADWSDEVDFVSNDHYFTAGDSHVDELLCSDALMDSLSLRKPWYVMEHSTSAVQWKPLNSRKRAGELIRDALAHVAMGADAVNFFQWRQSRSGAEAFHSSMVPHAGENTRVFREVCELGSILQELSTAGLQGSELEECDTAIIFDAESEWATRCQTLPSMNLNHWHDVREWYRALLDAGRRADVVPLRADWSGYHTVILPSVLALSAGQTRRLARFVRDGGTLVVGFATGIIDERFHVGLGGYPGAGEGLLRAVLGVRSEEFNILGELEDCVQVHPQDCTQERKACSDIEKGNRGGHTDESVQESAKDHDPAMVRLSNGFTSRLWANVVTSLEPTATVLATYEGPEAKEWELAGIPAIVRNTYGSGQAYYIGCDLERTDISRLLGLLNIDTASKTNVGMVHVRRTTKTECFDFYINRSRGSITIEGIQDTPVVAYRSTSAQSNAYVSNAYVSNAYVSNAYVSNAYVIERNGILIMKQEY